MAEEAEVIEDEIEGLLCTLEDTMERLPKGAWGLPVIRLRVEPVELGGEANTVAMNLTVTFSKKYPATPPTLLVEPVKGLDEKEVRELTQKLVAVAAEQAKTYGADGMPYIYSIFQAAKGLLQELNGGTSAFEQMEASRQEVARRELEAATGRRAQAEAEALTHAANFETQVREERERKARTMRLHRSPAVVAAEAPKPPPALALTSDADLLPRADESSSDRIVTPITPAAVHGSGGSFSRFQADYDELARIGRGGFGQVLKVRNRLDGMLYAVKIIKMEDSAMNKKILREVTTISRLYHRYIVRYYLAWVESDRPSQLYESSDGEDSWGNAYDSEDPDDWYGSVGVSARSTRSKSANKLSRKTSRGSRSSRRKAGPAGAAAGAGLTPARPRRQLSIVSDHTEGVEESAFAGIAVDSSEESSSDSDSSSSSSSSSSPASSSSSDEEVALGGGGGDSLLAQEVGKFGLNSAALFGTASSSGDGMPSTAAGGTPSAGEGDAAKSAASEDVPEEESTEFLYIAMEYCEGETLRQVIERETFEPAQIWTLFRQLLEALIYIHGRGVIHRDIKPDNVFLSEGNIKLGDFGLAVGAKNAKDREDSTTPPPVPVTEPALVSGTSESITTGVGTLLYRAPEQAVDLQQSTSRGYDQKADIFPLGIILFELWHPPFTTGMERTSVLQGLRLDPPVLPESFVKAVPSSVVDLIKWMLRHDVASRPSAQQILDSSLLPHRTETERAYLEEAVRAIAKPHGLFYGRLLDELFAQPTREPVDYTFENDVDFYDMSTAGGTAHQHKLNVMDVARFDELRQSLEKVFRLHGAVACETPAVTPKPAALAAGAKFDIMRLHLPTSLPPLDMSVEGIGSAVALAPALLMEASLVADNPATAKPSVARFLDTYGTVVQLPMDLCSPHARFVARHGVQDLKSFCVSRVFRGAPSRVGGQPRELYEATFDVVADVRAQDVAGAIGSTVGGISNIDPKGFARAAAPLEAETLLVAAEVTHGITQRFKQPFFFRVNNAKILRGVFEVCEIPPAVRGNIADVLSAACYTAFVTADQTVTADNVVDSWNKLRKHLRSKFELAQQSVDDLKTFVTLSPMPGAALAQIEQFILRKHNAILKRLQRSRATDQHRQQYFGLMMLAEGVYELGCTLASLSDAGGGWNAGSTSLAAAGTSGESVSPSAPSSVRATPALASLLSVACFCFDVGLTEKQGRYSMGFVFQVLRHSESAKKSTSKPERRSKKKKKAKEATGLQALADISGFNTACVAKGGRYDDLVARYRTPSDRKPPQVAVGVRFAINKLDNVIAECKKRPSLRTDVLVCCVDVAGGTLDRLAVANQLWAAGIAAEYLHATPLSFDALHRLCQASNFRVMVLVPPTFSESGIVKVHPVSKRKGTSEETLDISALAAFVSELLGAGASASAELPGSHTPAVSSRGIDSSSRKEDDAPTAPSSKQAAVSALNVNIEVVEGATSKNRLKTVHVDRRVASRLAAAVLPASNVPIPVLVTDRPYKLLREVGNAFLASGGNAELGSKGFKTDKRALRDVLARMADLWEAFQKQPPRNRPPCMLLYTLSGDVFDTVFVE